MFNKILGWIRSVVNKMFNVNIGTKFDVNIAISDKMITAISLWEKMYKDEAPWLNEDVISAGLPASISREFATATTVEFESEITGSKRADFLNETYKKLKKKLRKNLEYGCSLGGLVFKPYVANGQLLVDTIKGTNFFPVEYDSNEDCTAGIFVSRKVEGKYYFTRLEYHELDRSTRKYKIKNKAYMSSTEETLGQEISLKAVDDWQNIEEEVEINNIDRPLFGYFKIPLANTIDPDSPIGVSVYSRAVKLIEEADKQFARLLWEFEGSELAIDADPTALQSSKIMSEKLELPHLKKRLFRATGSNKDGKAFYEIFSPEIRETELYKGFNDILKRIEFVCGLAYGTISDPELIEKTATEIRSAKQRSYATVSDIQTALEDALEDTIYAMDVLATLYHLAPVGKYETSYEWDDSILVDAKEEQSIMMQEANMGYIKKEFYLMKRYGVTEEQAKEMMPAQQEDTTGDEE
jgi:A118 family predicted phage portal protein